MKHYIPNRTTSQKVPDFYRIRILAPSALVFFCIFLLLLHFSGSAREMEQKQKDTKELFQAAKRRELMMKY